MTISQAQNELNKKFLAEVGLFSQILLWHVANKIYSLSTSLTINRCIFPFLGHQPYQVKVQIYSVYRQTRNITQFIIIIIIVFIIAVIGTRQDIIHWHNIYLFEDFKFLFSITVQHSIIDGIGYSCSPSHLSCEQIYKKGQLSCNDICCNQGIKS